MTRDAASMIPPDAAFRRQSSHLNPPGGRHRQKRFPIGDAA